MSSRPERGRVRQTAAVASPRTTDRTLPAGASLLAWAVVAAATVLAVVTLLPPPPVADATSDEPSAAAAFAHVERIAVAPHPAGSAANDAVRGYLVDTLRGYGLDPQVRDTVGVHGDGPVEAARVRNVVATIPGTAPAERRGRVFLVAHYDSVQVGPGANDDGAGVATLLEAARLLPAGALPHDVVLLFTDAEEACLCGAEAFVAYDPLAAAGGVVLNVEARGTGGPVIMFETTRGNARVVAEYAAAAPHPVATSFAVEVYRILPNDTDFSPFRDVGRFTGLNSAYIDGAAAYHSPQDVPGRMDRAGLQAHVDNTVALARAFAGQDLRELATPAAADATYFPVFGTLARYPDALVWPLAILAAVAVGAVVAVACRRGATTLPRVAAGFAAALLPPLVAAALAQGGWALLVAVRPGYAAVRDPWDPTWYRWALVALVAAVVLGWYALLRRRVGAVALGVGGLGWLAVLGLVLAAAAPGGSYLAALPALAGAAALVAVGAARPLPGVVATTAGAVVAVVVLVPTAVLFFPALGLPVAAVPAFVLSLLGLALVPLIGLTVGRRVAGPTALVALVLAVVLGAAGLVVDRFDAANPVPAELRYVLDADAATARWVAATDPDPWTAQLVGDRERLDLPAITGEFTTGPAPVAAVATPRLDVLSNSSTGNGRVVTVRVDPGRDVRLLGLRTGAGPAVRAASAAGAPIPVRDGRLDLLFHAPPPGGLQVRLELAGPGPLPVTMVAGSDGLPGLPPRPPDVDAGHGHSSELLAVVATGEL